MGKLTINSVTECEGGGDYPVKLVAEIKNIGGGKKALNGKIVLPFVVDDSVMVSFHASKNIVTNLIFLHIKRYIIFYHR